ncbi:MAG: helix-turn-helix transcriptional regulator [Treponema sp.]|nr:helix-turn-helix transcriptional regulator [Treponema sp.]
MFFEDHLNEELKDPEFKKLYEEESRLLRLGYEISKAREKKGITQKELAEKSQITQQQLSKIENGVNCNLLTFIRVSSALGLNLKVTS